MHKNAPKCNETLSKWCKNKHGASKVIDTFETYHGPSLETRKRNDGERGSWARPNLKDKAPELLARSKQ
jgi:hypothetical protein